MYKLSSIRFQHTLLITSGLLFAISVFITIVWCGPMSTMGEMSMPGGWSMSMTWMRMPGQTWFTSAMVFTGMWTVMMVAMMLPSLVPILWRFQLAISNPGTKRIGWLTIQVCLGYFFFWALIGLFVYPVGALLTLIEMHWPAFARCVPLLSGVLLLLAGVFQFTHWKAHHLHIFRQLPGNVYSSSAKVSSALHKGIRLALHCSYCCLGQVVILFVAGVMDLRAMGVVTIAMAAERLLPAYERISRIIGIFTIGAGLIVILHVACVLVQFQ